MEALLCAVGFFLVFEGLFPFVSPEKWKEAIQTLLGIPNENIQKGAFCSVVLGLVLIWYTMAN